MIRHSVVFRLKYSKGTSEEKRFLNEVEKLRVIKGVKNFECLCQTGKKNNFDYGIFMEFDSLNAYGAYNDHSQHLAFVQNFWMNDVEDFLELDFEQP